MSKQYKSNYNVSGVTRFTKSPMAEVQFSRMTANPKWLLPFNAGDIVPVYYAEVLPHDTISLDLTYAIRMSTMARPTMGSLQVDYYAYFVPNRIVNESWKNVQGENTSGFWSAPEVNLAPLMNIDDGTAAVISGLQIPVGSVADYYGFPTQAPLRYSVLSRCNDLKFRGYLEIYNNYFRDQNYQPPIPYSKLNVYNGFFRSVDSPLGAVPIGNSVIGGISSTDLNIPASQPADGSYGAGAVKKAIYGDGALETTKDFIVPPRLTNWSALEKPLKANKLHDAFTSALPAPQKGADVYFGIGDVADVITSSTMHNVGTQNPIRFSSNGGTATNTGDNGFLGIWQKVLRSDASVNNASLANATTLDYTNLVADLSSATGITVNELRTAIATQQVYETLARGGSRYSSVLRNFFEIDTESPFPDIPIELGHLRQELDVYQVAQTVESENNPLGSLGGYGYTNKGGHIFERTFLEHGYIHVFAVVRHKNLYSTYFAPDNFRMGTLDFYLPPLANIGEQPVRLATLNPFIDSDDDDVLGYQEAWWEYREEPDRVSGYFRSGVEGSLNVWNYADEYDPDFTHINGDWLKSNTEEILNRTLSVTSELAPQFKGLFSWKVTKQRPMPTYSIPGLDTI